MNILDKLQEHVKYIPNKLLYRFEEGDNIYSLTFSQLDSEAKKVANYLTQNYQKGDRVLLLYPSGLDFIIAFIGCLYAGVIAVPAYPPRKNQRIDRLKSIISNSDAKVVLTISKTAEIIQNSFNSEAFLQDIPIIQSDRIEALDSFKFVDIDLEDIAFLQYTSGSTGEPKGVMVTHANIMSNMEALHQLVGYTKESRCVSWLPLFHDMGLMGGVLEPLYIGCEITLMSPTYFLQKPIRWLEAISRYQADISGGPNFAYELCINSIKDKDLEGLNLSSWKSAVNGAEPIYKETLERFTQKFAPYGFRETTHYPCYGMAETTLIITGGEQESRFNSISLDSDKLKEGLVVPTNQGQSLISCGKPTLEHKVIIDTKDNEDIGEILVKGSSVAKGYWNNKAKTKEVFGEYLRTGDLGFIYNNELFVCGRVKDLIIIRGQNYYPQDIEISVYNAHEALVDMGCAVFSIEKEGSERLVIVQEIKRTYLRKYNPQEIFSAICEEVGKEHELMVYDIVLIKPNGLLKTSSGKIQRYRNREFYLNGEFKPLATFLDKHQKTAQQSVKKDLELLKKSMPLVQKELLRLWVVDEVAQVCGIDKDSIDIEKSFVSFGMDSLKSIELQNRLSQILDIDTPLVWFYEYPTIIEFSDKIFEMINSENLSHKKALEPLVVDRSKLYEPFSLNDIQEAYLLGRDSSMVLGNTACFAYTELELNNIDLDRLQRAWNRVIEYFPMLRTTIDIENMTQSITPKVPYYKIEKIHLLDIKEIEQYRNKRLETILNPTQLPLFNLTAYYISDKVVLSFYIDMLICDASSIGVLLNKLKEFYNNKSVEPLGVIFRDYMLYKQSYKDSYRYKQSLEYWRARLKTLPSAPELPLAKAPKEIKKPKFTRRHFSMDKKRWRNFEQNSIELGSTPTAVLLACYAKVLALWSNSKHFCINLTLFDRLQVHKDINKIVGDFTSLNPLEVDVPSSKSFKEIIEEVKLQLFRDLEHKDVGGIEVLREMRSLNRDVSMPVVFTSMLGLDTIDTKWLGESLYTISQTPQVWIDNQISEVDGELVVNWDAIDELFPKGMLDDMFELYKEIVYRVGEDISLLENSKLYSFDNLYQEYNNTSKPISLEPLPLSFMEQLDRYANLDAIVCNDRRISYQQLHNSAVQIAQKIEQLGIKANEHVAILLPKGWEQVVSVLACGYAGVAYLPLSISYPKNRIEYLLQEADIKMVLSSSELFSDDKLEVIDVASFVDLDKSVPSYTIKAKSDNLAYTIFTSGSTGTPKGVMITHANIANTIRDMNQRFNLSSDDNFFALSELN
ncbi:MAG: AMP-binding protein, partial [Epsilonproteobacteria bacterium]|nr:AMP-binding protein [Campylobacterota bacterium]